MDRPWTFVWALLLSFAVFLGGVVTGVAADRLWLHAGPGRSAGREALWPSRPPPPPHEALVERFRERLHLSDSQTRIVDEALRQARDERRSIDARMRPELERITETSRERIRAVLDDDQKRIFERMTRHFERRFERRMERERDIEPERETQKEGD